MLYLFNFKKKQIPPIYLNLVFPFLSISFFISCESSSNTSTVSEPPSSQEGIDLEIQGGVQDTPYTDMDSLPTQDSFQAGTDHQPTLLWSTGDEEGTLGLGGLGVISTISA